MFVHMQLQAVIHPAGTLAMRHRQILQRAFAPFVADGTVQRVAGQQKFDDVFAGFGHHVGGCPHHHTGAYLHRAGRLQPSEAHLWRAIFVQHGLTCSPVNHGQANFHQAHAAHTYRSHFGMVAKNRNRIFNHFRGVNHQRAFRYAQFHAVNR